MTMLAPMDVAQIIDADPIEAASPSLSHWIFQDGDAVGNLTFRRFSQGGRHPYPSPSLLLLSAATDFRMARRLYGRQHGIPRVHVLRGTGVSHWGHQAIEEPAVRIAIGDGIARELRRLGIFREPVLSLPVGFNPAGLPFSTPAAIAARQQEPLLLAKHRPQLGEAIEQALRRCGRTSQLECFPSTRGRLEQAIARAPLVVDLGQATTAPNPGFPRLTAMALQTPLIVIRHDPDDDLCRDGRNALVREADVEQLCEAVLSLLGSEAEALRGRLLDGARSTVAQHQPARQRLRFEELLLDYPRHWAVACSSHTGARSETPSI